MYAGMLLKIFLCFVFYQRRMLQSLQIFIGLVEILVVGLAYFDQLLLLLA